MTTWQQVTLSLFWFSVQAHWAAIMLVLLPSWLKTYDLAVKERNMILVVFIGATISMLVAPFIGRWSDRVRTRWGRRTPFIIVGTLGNVAVLLLLAFHPAFTHSLLLFIIAFAGLELFNNLATAPYTALIPDLVPEAQRGTASGWMALMTMLGNFVGVACGLVLGTLNAVLKACHLPHVGLSGAFTLLALIMLMGMLATVLIVREGPSPAEIKPEESLRNLLAPLRAPDFRWVFITRLLVMMGIFTIQQFLLYYLLDVIAGGDKGFPFTVFGHVLTRQAESATSYFGVMLLAGAIISSLIAGVLSDRYGRKRMVYISGTLQGLVALAFIFIGRFDLVLIFGLVYGLGYGAYMAVDWALAADVLPSKEDTAKDMGVWHIALTLPQVLAPTIGGAVLWALKPVGAAYHLGYIVLFAIAFVYFLLGTLLIYRVKGAR